MRTTDELVARLRGPSPSIPVMRDAATRIEQLEATIETMRREHQQEIRDLQREPREDIRDAVAEARFDEQERFGGGF